jgi:hypothetical protein
MDFTIFENNDSLQSNSRPVKDRDLMPVKYQVSLAAVSMACWENGPIYQKTYWQNYGPLYREYMRSGLTT